MSDKDSGFDLQFQKLKLSADIKRDLVMVELDGFAPVGLTPDNAIEIGTALATIGEAVKRIANEKVEVSH